MSLQKARIVSFPEERAVPERRGRFDFRQVGFLRRGLFYFPPSLTMNHPNVLRSRRTMAETSLFHSGD